MWRPPLVEASLSRIGIPGRHLALREPFAVFEKPIEPEEFLDAVKRALT